VTASDGKPCLVQEQTLEFFREKVVRMTLSAMAELDR